MEINIVVNKWFFIKKKIYYKPFYETESINNFVVSSLKFVKHSPDLVNNRRPIC